MVPGSNPGRPIFIFPNVKDKQTKSDLLITKALAVLGTSLQPALKQNKQTATQKQVEKAIDELSIALKIK